MERQTETYNRRSRTKGFRGDTSFEEGLEPAPIEAVAQDEQDVESSEVAEEVAEEHEEVREPRRPSAIAKVFNSIISGSILSQDEVRKRYPYMLFVAFLMLMYIGNVFKMQHLHRSEIRLQKQVKELRAKSLTLTSNRMDATRQSNIVKLVQERGIDLQEALSPPKVIDESD